MQRSSGEKLRWSQGGGVVWLNCGLVWQMCFRSARSVVGITDTNQLNIRKKK